MPNALCRLTPEQAHLLVTTEGAVLIDVRSVDEFAAAHATGVLSLPLPDLERRAGELPTDRPLLCICASGHRSQIAVERLRALGKNNVTDVIGGTQAWAKSGLPMQRQPRVISLERQARGVAGALVFGFEALGFTVSPKFHWGAAFIGFMLTATALIGICPMMIVLSLLPWNRGIASSPTCPRGV